MSEALSDSDALAIVRSVIARAKKGDMVAARLVLDRLWPSPKGRPVTMKLPSVTNSDGIVGAIAAIISAMGDGLLSADEAAALSAVIETQRRAIETIELERRLAAIEQRIEASEQVA